MLCASAASWQAAHKNVHKATHLCSTCSQLRACLVDLSLCCPNLLLTLSCLLQPPAEHRQTAVRPPQAEYTAIRTLHAGTNRATSTMPTCHRHGSHTRSCSSGHFRVPHCGCVVVPSPTFPPRQPCPPLLPHQQRPVSRAWSLQSQQQRRAPQLQPPRSCCRTCATQGPPGCGACPATAQPSTAQHKTTCSGCRTMTSLGAHMQTVTKRQKHDFDDHHSPPDCIGQVTGPHQSGQHSRNARPNAGPSHRAHAASPPPAVLPAAPAGSCPW